MGYIYAPRESRVTPTWQDSPSWSWAALHKPVTWEHELYDNKVHYLCDIDLHRLPGIIQLRLCGMLMLCPSNYSLLTIRGSTNILHCEILGSDNSGLELTLSPDQWFDSTLEESRESRAEVTPVSPGEEIDGSHDMERKAFLEGLVIMPILWFNRRQKEDSGTQVRVACCLLLHAQLGAERGVYRRVGVMKASKRCDEELDLDTNLFESHQRPLDYHLFREVNDDGKYTIIVL